jgi:hypothetical protein
MKRSGRALPKGGAVQYYGISQKAGCLPPEESDGSREAQGLHSVQPGLHCIEPTGSGWRPYPSSVILLYEA